MYNIILFLSHSKYIIRVINLLRFCSVFCQKVINYFEEKILTEKAIEKKIQENISEMTTKYVSL